MKKFLKNIQKNWVLVFICFSVTGLSYFSLFHHYGNLERKDFIYLVESNILDWKLRNRGADETPTKVGILAIDEQSIGLFGRWPFSRRYYAQAFANLKKLGVKWIGFDAVWAEPEKTLLSDVLIDLNGMNSRNMKQKVKGINTLINNSPSDSMFIDSIGEFQNIVMGFFYFGSKMETKLNFGDRDPFIGIEGIEPSAIEMYDMPEDFEIADYPYLKQGFGIVVNTPAHAAASNHHAFFSNDADEDAINRWVTMVANINNQLMPSLALKTAAEYMERDIFVIFDDLGIESIGLVSREDDEDMIEIPMDPYGAGRILANHRGPSRAFHHFSLADAYKNSFSEEEKIELQNSVLLLGATATGINDLRPNPFDPAIDGVENHAAALDNILKQDFLKRPATIYGTELMIVIGIGLLFSPLLIWGNSVLSGLAVVVFLIGYYMVDKYIWFNNGVWTYMAVPSAQILSMFVITNLFKYITEEKDKKFLKQAFSSYISPELIDDMYASGEPPRLGGHSAILSAYFTDIQSFSSFSEKLSATKLVELLNEYLTRMTDILLEEKGTLDKYEGDAIIAFFGAPMHLEDHAVRSCTVAVKMQNALMELRHKWTNEGDKWPQIVKDMRMRIGINSGEIVTGNMGSRDRMNYTMMGDSVNLAARLEEAAKQYGIFTQVSEYTKDLTGDHFVMRELDTIRVVGKSEPVTTYDLLGITGKTNDLLLNLQQSFHDALAHYKKMEWDSATEGFNKSLEYEYQRFPDLKGKKTNPSLVYLERCEEFRKAPPPADWDGVYVLTSK